MKPKEVKQITTAAAACPKSKRKKRGKRRKKDEEICNFQEKKMRLTTGNNKNYDGTLNIPDKVAQRKFESTGQFFRRLDRLVAKAKVEADLATRFDIRTDQKKKANNNKA